MKVAFILVITFLSSHVLASSTLSFQESVQVTPVTKSPDLPANHHELHRDFHYQERTIAGKKKKTWLDNLHSRLKGYKGNFRF